MSGKVYRIFSEFGDLEYIGSTRKTLNERMSYHIRDYNRSKGRLCSSYIIFEKYGVENCKIELLYQTNETETLNRIEGEFILSRMSVNKRVEGRTDKEYRDEPINKQKKIEYDADPVNKQRRKIYLAEYNTNQINKEKIKEYKRIWYLNKKNNL